MLYRTPARTCSPAGSALNVRFASPNQPRSSLYVVALVWMSSGVQVRLPPAMTVRPPEKGAFRFRNTVARIVRFLAWLIGTASFSWKFTLHRTTPPLPLAYCTRPPRFSIGLTVAFHCGSALHFQRDIVDADIRTFGRIRLPLDQLHRDAAGASRRIDGKGLRVAAGVQIELDAILPVEQQGNSRRGAVIDRLVVRVFHDGLFRREGPDGFRTACRLGDRGSR